MILHSWAMGKLMICVAVCLLIKFQRGLSVRCRLWTNLLTENWGGACSPPVAGYTEHCAPESEKSGKIFSLFIPCTDDLQTRESLPTITLPQCYQKCQKLSRYWVEELLWICLCGALCGQGWLSMGTGYKAAWAEFYHSKPPQKNLLFLRELGCRAFRGN